ncbi:hypothetical protein EDD34_3743 [Myceligenerans xiligouense]|uniref:LppM domain-containing protein n=2 Tax=Myceligenerans xiligouense TaxID=253184 RepID=A0A3N4YUL2_9MICO|nr:hypothetical protein EDD34_3743 [Myceligenerans xiligouense]
MDMALTINGDDTVDGEVVVAVEDSAAAAIGATPEELLEGADADSFGEDASEVEPYAEGGFTGTRYIFEGSPLDDFSDSEMSIVRDGDEFLVEGSLPMTTEDLDMTEEELADPATQELLKQFAVNIAFTFPGEVIESNGKTDGNTVTWAAEIGEENTLTARASALTGDEVAAAEEAAAVDSAAEQEETGFWGSLLGTVIIGAGIGLVVGLIFAGIRAARNRKTTATGESTPPTAAADPVGTDQA